MKRVFLTTVLFFSCALVCSAQTTFYFPQVADGGGWRTTIFITNAAATNTNVASVTVRFTKSSGAAFALTMLDSAGAVASTGSTLAFQVAGGQTRKFVSLGDAPTTDIGFATVTSTQPVTGNAIFSQFNGAHLQSEAGVPASSPSARQSIFVDTSGGFHTGVAVANPNAAAADLTLTLLNTEGVLVATTAKSLLPTNHTAAFTEELFVGTPGAGPLVGSLQIVSSVPVPAVALRFSPDFAAFTTLFPVNLASLITPAVNWFEQRPWAEPFVAVARLLGALDFRMG